MKRGNKARPIRYQDFYGLHFMFAERVWNKISEKHNLPLQMVKDFTILYYLQKYVLKSNVIVITELASIAQVFGYDRLNKVRVGNILRRLNNEGKIEFYGMRYHLNNTSTQFISAYSYWFHFYISNFHELVEERREMLKEHKPPKKRRRRRKRTKKT